MRNIFKFILKNILKYKIYSYICPILNQNKMETLNKPQIDFKHTQEFKGVIEYVDKDSNVICSTTLLKLESWLIDTMEDEYGNKLYPAPSVLTEYIDNNWQLVTENFYNEVLSA